jgi:hypothetical protein
MFPSITTKEMLLAIYSPLYEIIIGIVLGGQATLTSARAATMVSCRPYCLLAELPAAGAMMLNIQTENQLKSSVYCHPISTREIRGTAKSGAFLVYAII